MVIPLIVLCILLVVWCGALSYLFYRQYSSLQKIVDGDKKRTVVDILGEVLDKQSGLEKAHGLINDKVEGLIFDSQFYIQKIGLVRFNPFNDTGGDQSFILSLVDSDNSGVVVSGLHTRNGTRWYAKKVQNGKGVEHELSSDEVKAIKAATKRAVK
jgi:hypothetical protein